jgi:RNA polymerase sigma factor (sigma-70 family)
MDKALNKDYISIVDTFKKKCLCKDPDEWSQLRNIIIWKAVRDYEEGHNTKFESYLFTKSKFEVMKFNTSYIRSINNYISLNFVEEPYYDTCEKNNLIECIDCLPEDYQKILIYKYYDGFTSKEICKLMNITSNDYKNMMFNAINTLRSIGDKRNFD